MKELFDEVSAKCSKLTTNHYSTSFSLGIYFLDRKFHEPVYNIYGFVRLADEIVDTFHDFEREKLLAEFKEETFKAIRQKISLNPILNSFQKTVNTYGIEDALINTFLRSMEMDLTHNCHDDASFEEYILGSAEVVGLMCLRVFCEGDNELYDELKAPAMRLGAAFQKVNFLRDLKYDYKTLQRSYFPDIDFTNFTVEKKQALEDDMKKDFKAALEGIKKLPHSARFGVYVAYVYFRALLEKIEKAPREKLMEKRLRVPNYEKFNLLLHSYFRYNFGEMV